MAILKFQNVLIILLLILLLKRWSKNQQRILKSLLNIFCFFHRTVAEMDEKQLGISNKID